MTTIEDALVAARAVHDCYPSPNTHKILAFLEPLEARTQVESIIASDADGFIVEGAYQNGFDWIDDDASLLVVHQNDLIKYVWMQRAARWLSPARYEMQTGLVVKAWRSGAIAAVNYTGNPKLASCDYFIQLPSIPEEGS